MSVIIQWEDPPPDGRSTRNPPINHGAIAAKLRRWPGKWGRVIEMSGPGWLTQISQGLLPAYRPVGAFEVLYRQGNVYARYVGEVTK